MLQNTHAIVLKVNPKGETSAVLHCYSRDHGKLILIAKGAKSPKSPFRGLIEPFSHLNVHFNEKPDRPYQFLSQAEYVDPFTHLKSRPEAVLYGSIILEILYKEHEIETDPLLYDLLLQTFSAMDKDISPQTAHWHFLMKFLEIEGLSLNTDTCSQCDHPLTTGYFYPRSGQIRCEHCRENFTLNWELNENTMSILKRLPHMSPDRLPDISELPCDAGLINRILWNTLATRFDTCRTLKSVDILKTFNGLEG